MVSIRIWSESRSHLYLIRAARVLVLGKEPGALNEGLEWATDLALARCEHGLAIPKRVAKDKNLVAIAIPEDLKRKLERVAAYLSLQDGQYHRTPETVHDIIAFGLEVAKDEAGRLRHS